MGHCLRVWLALTLPAFLCISCLPVTDTLYPVLNFKTARPSKPGIVGIQVAAESATIITAHPGRSGMTLTEGNQAPAVHLGLSLGLTPRVDASGEFLYGLGVNTASPGLRLRSRIRVSNTASATAVSLQPAFIYTAAHDEGDADYPGAPTESLRSSLLAGDLRVLLTRLVSRRSDVTLGAGAAATRYHAFFDGFDSNTLPISYKLDRTRIAPLFTLGFRFGVLMAEAGAYRVGARWESAAGIAVGK